MARLWKNILSGARQVLVLFPDSDYVRPKRGDAAADLDNLRKSVRSVSNDFNKKALEYGKQTHSR